MAKINYTQKTLRAQKGKGRLCAISEKWVPTDFGGFRKDLFGIIDVVALDPAEGIIGIQSTGPSGFRTHLKEMTESLEIYKDTGLTKWEACVEWLKAGGKLELWGWRKILKGRKGKKKYWIPRVAVFSLGEGGELQWEELK